MNNPAYSVNTIAKLVRCLLVDIRKKTGVSLTPPVSDSELVDWAVIEAPQLDKALLRFIDRWSSNKVFYNQRGIITPEAYEDYAELLNLTPEWLIPLLGKFWDDFAREKDTEEEILTIVALRQLLAFCYKVEHAPTKTQIQEALSGFLETDESIAIWDSTFNSDRPGRYYSYARSLISRVLSKSSRDELLNSIEPSHGPGAVFPSAKPWEKSMFSTVYPSIEDYYPFDRWLWQIFVEDLPSDASAEVLQAKREEGICAKLVMVPKDSRGPRLICVHPKEAVYIQQGQRKWLERLIEKHPLTKDSISFTDQGVNQRLALMSSMYREFATLDLKDASDRIANSLVRYLFAGYEDILSCARADRVRLPDGSVVVLKKWAPMGNCLTFPVESLTFWALCSAALYIDCGIKPLHNGVHVFGDDIILPSEHLDAVKERLVAAGLVPNAAKTFSKGFFRESCGLDAYMGAVVTPLRLRRGSPSSVSGALAFCNLGNRARAKGYCALAAELFAQVRKHWYVGLTNDPNAQALCEYTGSSSVDILCSDPRSLRFNENLQRWETRALLPRVQKAGKRNTRWCLVDSLQRIRDRGDSNCLPSYAWATEAQHVEAFKHLGVGVVDLEPYVSVIYGLQKPQDKYPTIGELAWSERGLEYADPDRIRLIPGWIPVA